MAVELNLALMALTVCCGAQARAEHQATPVAGGHHLSGRELSDALSGYRFVGHTSATLVTPYFEEYYPNGSVRIGGDPGMMARYIVDGEEFCVLSRFSPKLCRTLELVDDTHVYFVENRGKDQFRTLLDRHQAK